MSEGCYRSSASERGSKKSWYRGNRKREVSTNPAVLISPHQRVKRGRGRAAIGNTNGGKKTRERCDRNPINGQRTG